MSDACTLRSAAWRVRQAADTLRRRSDRLRTTATGRMEQLRRARDPAPMNAARTLLTVALVVANAAQAQDRPAPDDVLALAAMAIGPQRAVAGAPFCADVLQDVAAERRTGRLCRDGRGRLRFDQQHDGRRLSYLRDAVSGHDWLLDPQRHTAWRLPVQMPLAVDAPGPWSEQGARMRSWLAEWLRGLQVPAPPAIPPIPGRSTQPAVPEVPAIPAWPAPPSAGARPLAPPPPLGVPVVTLLPSRQVDGLRARGERLTWASPGGGQVVHEVWTLPELQLTLSVKESDPRHGERLLQLQQLQRGEPDAAAMQVPAADARR